MKLCIAAVGQKMPPWSEEAVRDFTGRMPRDFAVAVRSVRPEARSGQPVARLMAAEAQRLRESIPEGALVVAMDEAGRDWTSTELAAALGRWRDEARDVAFLIGGADGLAPELKQAADLQLRLSSMTLPHALARVVLAEQLYRAWSILAGHPYHRGERGAD